MRQGGGARRAWPRVPPSHRRWWPGCSGRASLSRLRVRRTPGVAASFISFSFVDRLVRARRWGCRRGLSAYTAKRGCGGKETVMEW
ncbi:hypothetical protein NN561_020144 [Cricetulus griseus]